MLGLPAPLAFDAPATTANVRRNARAGVDRWTRWAPVRDACQAFLAPYVDRRARVAVVGAGNGDDLPLRWLAARAGRIDLFDLDTDALRTARRHLARRLAYRVRLHALDITGGRADDIVRAVRDGAGVDVPVTQLPPLSPTPYDVVIGDLLYSQLLAPALGDLDLDDGTTGATLTREGQRLTAAVVARLHASAPGGVAIHLHDPLGWWPGCEQPFAVEDALARATADADPAHVLRGGRTPRGCDPRASIAADRILATGWWRWPFAIDTDYLVCATAVELKRPPFR